MVRFGLYLFSLIALVGLVSPGRADMLFTASGTGSDGALSASADFVAGNGQLTITLANLLTPSQIGAAGQALSDVSFTLSNSPGTVGSRSATGTLATIDANGNVTSPTPGASIPRWVGLGPPPPGGTGTFTVNGNNILVEVIGGGQPSDMILPAGTSYPNANSSITGGQFNPFVVGPLTVTLNLSGVTTSTTVSNVRLSFGTGPDTFLPGTPSSGPGVPEIDPGSAASALTVLFGGVMMLFDRRRRQK